METTLPVDAQIVLIFFASIAGIWCMCCCFGKGGACDLNPTSIQQNSVKEQITSNV